MDGFSSSTRVSVTSHVVLLPASSVTVMDTTCWYAVSAVEGCAGRRALRDRQVAGCRAVVAGNHLIGQVGDHARAVARAVGTDQYILIVGAVGDGRILIVHQGQRHVARRAVARFVRYRDGIHNLLAESTCRLPGSV